MNAKKLRRVAGCFGCLLAGVLNADVVWTGAVNGTWDASTLNWRDGASAAAFAPGADARFDDGASRTDVSLSGDVSAGAVVFDAAAGYTLAGTRLVAATNFIKRGAGELKITGAGHTFAGDILIEEGRLTVAADNDVKDVMYGPLGHPRAPRTITVLTNGTLNIVGKSPFGGGTSSTPVLADLRIIGGTLNLTTNFSLNLGSLLLDNATVNYAGGYGSATPGGRNWGWLNFGSNVTFKGEAPYVFDQRGSKACVITLGKHRPTDVWVDDITGDAAADVTFAMPVDNVADGAGQSGGFATRFNKLGPGTLSLTSNQNDFTGAVAVVEGTLEAAANYASLTAVSSVLGNPRVPHTISVGTNATLVFAKTDILGQTWSHPLIEIVVSGGTLVQSNGLSNSLGPLTLDNAALVYSGRNGNWGTFVFDGDVTFRGTNAYNLAVVNDSRIRCGYNRMTFFNVEDIPGADVDVTVGMLIENCQAWGSTAAARPSRLGKRGAGTLRLANHSNTFTGDVEVAEGVLQIPLGGNTENKVISCLGNPQVATRTVTVHSGGELFFMASDTLGQLASTVQMALVVSNGTLRLADEKCNGFGPLTLHNAEVVYGRGSASTRVWGTFCFGGKTVFSGTNAYTFPAHDANNRASLGYGLDFREEPIANNLTNWHGKTEFAVQDITGGAGADVTFGMPLQDIPDWVNTTKFKNIRFICGLLKSGAGTLRLASAGNTYSGPTVVSEGVLRVDGALTASAVTVKDGGWLGGTGTVAAVTLEDGAGFEALAGQAQPLNVGALAAAGGVTVRVRNPEGVAAETLNAAVAKVAGGVDVSGWTVVMDGVAPTPNLRVKTEADGVVYARWSPRGTAVLIL